MDGLVGELIDGCAPRYSFVFWGLGCPAVRVAARVRL